MIPLMLTVVNISIYPYIKLHKVLIIDKDVICDYLLIGEI